MAIGVLVLCCNRREPSSRTGGVGLIGAEYSELRHAPLASLRARTTFDLTAPAAIELVSVIDATGVPQSDGLRVIPATNDPILTFTQPLPPFNRVTVLLQAGAPGVMQVFWARDEEPFAETRSRTLPVERSEGFERYVFDLADAISPQPGYRLRIDPLDRQAPVLVASIELADFAFTAERAVAGVPVARKVKLGTETREALVVSPQAPVAIAVVVPEEAALSFGLGGAPRDPAGATVVLAFHGQGGAVVPLLEEELPAGEAGQWRDRTVSLRGLAGRSGHLVASVEAGAGAAPAAAVFWSNPRLLGAEPARDRPNVLLVSLDTLGASHLTAYGATGVDDPFLTRLASQGTLFEQSFATSSITHVAHASMLTGLPPLEGNLFWFGEGRLEEATLAEVLRASGYATAAFTGGELITASLGFDRGFEVFHEEDTLSKGLLERTDIRSLLRRAAAWTADAPEPWLVFVHSYEAHTPYYRRRVGDTAGPASPEQFRSIDHLRGRRPLSLADLGRHLWRLDADQREVNRAGERVGPADLDEIRRTYRSEIGLLDRALADFVAGLERRGTLANTVLVVTADHGEAFFEHGLLEHGLLYDENLRVPLLLWGPGRVPAGVRVAAPVTSLDVMPTVLELAGTRGGRPVGRSLVPASRGEDLVPVESYAFVPGDGLAVVDRQDRKLIWQMALLAETYGRRQAFDRRLDPGETVDLLVRGGPGVRSLEAAAVELAERLPGAHLRFAAFAGRTCTLALDGDSVHPDHLYAMGIELQQPRGEWSEGSRKWSGSVRFTEEPRLIVVDNRLTGWIDVRLDCEHGASGEYRLRFAALGSEPRALAPASGGSPALTAWLVPTTGADSGRGGLTEEQRQRLRTLGYVR